MIYDYNTEGNEKRSGTLMMEAVVAWPPWVIGQL
jgi:hypothetical protein